MKTKKFRVAKAGQTTDGRAIPLEHIKQMAASYSPAKYGARVNIEHIKSYSPESSFKAYGDVVSLSTEEDGDDTYLVAEVDPTDDLVSLSKARQKVYFSIEYNPNFADEGSAYLVGLACTDSPASLGTSYMQFCQQHPDENPLTARKSTPENVITTAEFSVSFEAAKPPKTSLFSTLTQLFTIDKTDDEQKDDQDAKDLAKTIKDLPTALASLQAGMLELAKSSDETNRRFDEALNSQAEKNKVITELQTTLDNTPATGFSARPLATGSDNADYAKTDC